MKITPRHIQHNGKMYWRVCIPRSVMDAVHATGRKKLFGTEDDALQFIAQLKAQTGGLGAKFLTLPYEDQLKVLIALQEVGTAARLVEAARAFQNQTAPAPVHPIKAVVAECLASKKSAGLRDRSLAGLKSSLTKFAVSIGTPNLHDVTPAMIEAWLSGNGWAAGTRRGYLTDLRTFFSFAIKRGYIKESAALGVDKPMDERGAPGIHPIKEVIRLLTTAQKTDPGLLGYIAPIYFGGLRPDECANLDKKHIHDGLLEVTPENSKTRQRRFIPINDTLAAWLAVKGVEYSPINLIRRLRRLRKEARVTWPHDVLRHSFCSYGIPKYGAQLIAAWAGHSESILFKHYRARVTPADADLYWAARPATNQPATQPPPNNDPRPANQNPPPATPSHPARSRKTRPA